MHQYYIYISPEKSDDGMKISAKNNIIAISDKFSIINATVGLNVLKLLLKKQFVCALVMIVINFLIFKGYFVIPSGIVINSSVVNVGFLTSFINCAYIYLSAFFMNYIVFVISRRCLARKKYQLAGIVNAKKESEAIDAILSKISDKITLTA